MKWYEEAEFYHIYPIGALGAPRKNDYSGVVHRIPELTEIWLPHIRDLGFSAIYIGPLFESSAHGYDTTDYKKVDERLGDNDDFAAFVRAAHEMGIRVVVDGVFNHTGRDFFAFRDIQEKKWDSPYRNWYKGINFDWNSAYNDGFSYESWHGCGDLVNLNYGERAVHDYMLGVIDYWIDTFDIDGIRLDCADCLDFGFLQEMRARTDAKKEDFWLMGEVIHGDYSRWIGDGAHMLHSVTNYELWKGLYSGQNSHNFFEIAHTIRREFGDEWGIYKGMKLYTFADNHDVNRVASLLEDPRNLRSEYTMVYLLPGIPSVYYGSEYGIPGRKEDGGDDALRPRLDIEAMEKDSPHPEVAAWIRKLGEVRGAHPCCAEGHYEERLLTNRQYAFSRKNDDDEVLAVLNNDEAEAVVSVPVSFGGHGYQDIETGEILRPENNTLNIQILPCSSRVFVVL